MSERSQLKKEKVALVTIRKTAEYLLKTVDALCKAKASSGKFETEDTDVGSLINEMFDIVNEIDNTFNEE